MSLAAILIALENGELDIADIYQQLNDRYQNWEPHIQAMATPVSAELVDGFLKKARDMGDLPLKGLPVLIKDAVTTKDFPTSFGLKKYESYQAEDAKVVELIRQAGGVIVGKTRVPPRTLDYQTFNSLVGTTSHPLDLARTPGGSSGGNAAALAAGYTDLAVGTDIGGSLRQPAAYCGIYSFKPALGNISTEGTMPPGKQTYLETVGPMSTSLEGCWLLAQVMMERKNLEPLNVNNSDNYRVLVTPKLGEVVIDDRISQMVGQLAQLDGINCDLTEEVPDLELIKKTYLQLFELDTETVEQYLATNPAENLDTDLDTDLKGQDQVAPAMRMQKKVKEQITEIMKGYDAWILPGSSTTAIRHNPRREPININGQQINYWKAMGQIYQPATVAGLPVITQPVGRINHLPVGIQLLGRVGMEQQLFQIVYVIRKLLMKHTNFSY